MLGNLPAYSTLVRVPHVEVMCENCKGRGAVGAYPEDTSYCIPCQGTGQSKRHPTERVTGWGCERCMCTWRHPEVPYCPDCGVDATLYEVTGG